MGLSERDPDEPARAVGGSPAGRRPHDAGRWAGRPVPSAPGSNEPLYDPPRPGRAAPRPAGDAERTGTDPAGDAGTDPPVTGPPETGSPAAGLPELDPPDAGLPETDPPDAGLPETDPPDAGGAGADAVGAGGAEAAVPPGDPVALLGCLVEHDAVRRAFRAWGLHPSSGAPDGAGPSRSYRARAAGLEVAADAHGVVTTVFLHFHGDDGFATYQGRIPGAAGAVPRRASLRAHLGEPDGVGDPYRDRFLGDFGPWDRWELPGCTLHAQYAHDGERLHRVTLTPAPPR